MTNGLITLQLGSWDVTFGSAAEFSQIPVSQLQRIVGVYLLIQSDNRCYAGQSTNGYLRIQANGKRLPDASAMFIAYKKPIPAEFIDTLEYILIQICLLAGFDSLGKAQPIPRINKKSLALSMKLATDIFIKNTDVIDEILGAVSLRLVTAALEVRRLIAGFGHIKHSRWGMGAKRYLPVRETF